MKENYYRLERKRKKKKNTRLIMLAGIAVLVSFGVIAAAAVMNQSFGDITSSQDNTAKHPAGNISQSNSHTSSHASSTPVSQTSSAPKTSSAKTQSSSSIPAHTGVSSTVRKPGSNTTISGYDYSKMVGKSEAVSLSYFSDAALIGDSRAVGLVSYAGLSNIKSYAKVSGSAKMVMETKNISTSSGQKVTILEDIKSQPNKFKKVYIMMGINEIGYQNYATLMERYSTIIDEIKASQKDVQIYLQAVLPITKLTEQKHSYLRMSKIKSFNTQLQKLAAKKKIYYIDPSEVFLGSDGFMKTEAAASTKDYGVHFNKSYCQKWLEYLKTHTVV